MKKKTKQTDNPLHTEYGILSNAVFVIKKMRQYDACAIRFLVLGIFTNSLMKYMWSFIGKFVIDIAQAQAQTPDKSVIPLLRLLLITTAAELTVMVLNTVSSNRQSFHFVYTRMCVITENISKAMTMNYQSLEKPDILDMYQKSRQATSSNDCGVEGMMRALYDLGINLVLLLVTVTTVSTLDPVLIVILAVVAGIQFFFFRRTVQKDRKDVWNVLAPSWRKINYMWRVTQDFDYAKDIRLFHMKNWLAAKQDDILMDKQALMIHSRNLWIQNSVFAHAMSILSNAAVYAILIYKVLDINMSIGNFTLFLGLAGTFSGAMTNFLNTLGTLKQYSLQTDDFRSFMDLPTEDMHGLIPLPESSTYRFEFKNVSFRYEGAKDYALKNLNLTLEAGRKLAVVGLNGAGKTTFIKLLLRLYDVTEGEILLNGTNIKHFKREEYYRLFSPVFQNVELFAFPMSENISMKRPGETDKDLAIRCAVKAGLKDKLENLPEGIDTELLKVIRDDGIDLSGGERQKLALAKALYKNAPVIVLDEPTAALDALAEYNLYKNFNEMIGDKTAVYISHRLSSTRFCDSIAMFKAGELVEYGTHEELLAKKGAYAEMFEIQAQYYRNHPESEDGNQTEGELSYD